MARIRIGEGQQGRRRQIKQLRIGISDGSIRRLARWAGVVRIAKNSYNEVKGCLNFFLETIIKDTLTYMEYAHRKTILTSDVLFALRRNGKQIYLWSIYYINY